MAAALVERAWRDTTPESADDDLAALWRDLASRGAVAHAVMSNLVVFRFHERRRGASAPPPTASELIEDVLGRHPSRAIVIEHEHGQHDEQGPTAASVGICVYGTSAARYAVEQVVVRSASAEASLPSIVRRFMRGGLPTSIWWTEDLSRWPPPAALLASARQVIYDSRAWSDVPAGLAHAATLVNEGRVDVADLNWRRLAPMRRALEHIAPAVAADAPVRIAGAPGEAALAALAAGWIVGGQPWPAEVWPTLAEQPSGDVLLQVVVGEGTGAVTALMDRNRILVRQHGAADLTLPARQDTDGEAIAAELRSLSPDPALHAALIASGRRA